MRAGAGMPTRTSLRPVGHITGIVRELDRWATRREAKNLGSRELRVAINYLEEYRELINQVKSDQYLTGV